ncbi:hypothetical protein [Trichormus variabilis]|uniref:Helicase/UvrB N-terminal domain-containing protein n=1 Tax=Trichormus variabilis SAG 1403-4b TaxID=447716 RepID=A0A3S1BYP3_ANAVA|nr:hypothetical protein [Trichormus variabilis]MBD2629227.1 hypothetical protein [Trichormus variabilis FACHB-164]RUS93850.1 hypothetical protein DSM107003_40860 [Trichormus variabilis SAG 1403-4b]
MQDILNKYCANKQGLLLLSMPTGFGKTYNVLKYIYDNYKEFADQKKKIIFITNLKKNLPFKELKEQFIKNGNEDDFDKYVLFIDSNSESVINNLINLDNENFDDFKDKESYKKLNECIEICKNKKLPKKVQDSFKDQIRTELEPVFRGDIQKILKERFTSKEARLKAIKTDANYQWIGKLYPAVFTDERTVLFMSIDKFIVKNSTLIEPSYLFSERLDKKPFNNPVIFIDEFDSTKEAILKNIINSGLQGKLDFMDLFLNIHNHLKQLKDSQDLTKPSKHWKQKKAEKTAQGKDWLSPKEHIEDLKKKAQEIFNKYQLQHTCKSDPEFFKSRKRNFLFYDYKFHNVIDSKKRIEIHQKPKQRTNWIKAVDCQEDQTELTSDNIYNIYSLLGEIGGFLSYFQRGVSYVADNYRHLKRDDKSLKEVFNLEFAIRSVLNHFRLDDKDVDLLTNNIMADELPYKLSSEQPITKLQSFYERGFRYYDIVDSDEHDTLSKIYMFNFNYTPEARLADICSKAMVVGISATAGLYTNIGNYDINYLESRLGDSYINIEKHEVDDLKNKYDQATQGYDKVTIKAEFIGTNSQKEAMKQLQKLLKEEEAANSLLGELKQTIKDTNDSTVEFAFCRYVRALTAWKYFIDHAECHSFLCFFQKLPKENDPDFNINTFKKYAKYILGSELDEKEQDSYIKQTIVTLTTEDFGATKEKIAKDLKENKRRFIISAYQTIGVGQNLQFPIPSSLEATAIHIDNREKSQDIDINGIYLDNPTNLLVNINNKSFKDNDFDFIKYIFQLEFLRENKAFTPSTFKSKLKEAFQRYVGNYEKKAGNFSLYDTNGYSRFLNKVIMQAIGRICRTNMKCPTIHILADNAIRKHLTEFSLPENVIPVHEYTELLKEASKLSEKSQDTKEAENDAVNRSEVSNAYILSTLDKTWNAQGVKEWQDLRQQVLQYPTLIKESECNHKWHNIYVQLPKPGNSYYFSQENDYKEIEVSFNYEYGKKEVSEKNIRLAELMRIDILRELFIKNGYATEFTESELMITPPIYNNIYKGALGEVCGKHILETSLNISLLDLNLNEYERFDFKTEKNIYIDFKFWHTQNQQEADELIDKIRKKMKEVKAERVYIINILGNSDTEFLPIPSDQGKIVEVPYLCKNDQVDSQAIEFIIKEFSK